MFKEAIVTRHDDTHVQVDLTKYKYDKNRSSDTNIRLLEECMTMYDRIKHVKLRISMFINFIWFGYMFLSTISIYFIVWLNQHHEIGKYFYIIYMSLIATLTIHIIYTITKTHKVYNRRLSECKTIQSVLYRIISTYDPFMNMIEREMKHAKSKREI